MGCYKITNPLVLVKITTYPPADQEAEIPTMTFNSFPTKRMSTHPRPLKMNNP